MSEVPETMTPDKEVLIDAAIPRAMLLEIFTKEGIGTEIVRADRGAGAE